MTKEAFESETLRLLDRQKLLHPAMEGADTVKFLFQAMLGVGHLLSSRDAVIAYVLQEAQALAPDPDEALIEEISPCWARLNLRRAMAEGIPAETVADLMAASRPALHFTRRDVYELCARLAAEGGYELPGAPEIERIPDEDWLPSHSEAYRRLYKPAYRVISMDQAAKLAEKYPR